MADRRSRHRNQPTYQRPAADGEPITLLTPRRSQHAGRTVRHTLAAGERLDHLAHRYFGDAHQYWRLADAAEVIHPDDLLRPGGEVEIPEGDG